jgi:uncharacterized protein YsxB (DUF464 family)
MIKAIYHRKYNRLTVTGHAGAAETGHDLVCAATSALAYTLAANVANMADAGQVREPIIKTDVGDAEVSCKPHHNLKSTVTLVFDSVCVGFEVLAHNYPDNISYEIRR